MSDPVSSLGTTLQMPLPGEGDVITRVYRGTLERASLDANEHGVYLAKLGYKEQSRLYTPGSYGCGAFLMALLLAVVLVGIVILVYLLVVKPPGSLVVTYARSGDLANDVPSDGDAPAG